MKKYLLMLVSAIFLVVASAGQTQAASSYVVTTYQTPVSINQVWKQTFKEKVSKKTVTTQNIYLTEYNKSTRVSLNITLLNGDKTVQIQPKKALKSGVKYTLIIKNIKSAKGKLLTTKSIKKVFTTKPIKPATTDPIVQTPLTVILSTQIKTTNNTVPGVITEKDGKVSITYDFRTTSIQDVVQSSSLVAAQNYTLTYTKLPALVSTAIPANYVDTLVKGDNNLLMAEKLKANNITMQLAQLLADPNGTLNIEGILTNDAGQQTPITFTFVMK